MQKEIPSYWVWIYLSGDRSVIEQSCREYCLCGLCVTVENVKYIYTGGEELGVRVGLINYPRFPDENSGIWDTAVDMAIKLRNGAYQDSVLIMDNEKTLWITNRN